LRDQLKAGRCSKQLGAGSSLFYVRSNGPDERSRRPSMRLETRGGRTKDLTESAKQI
jgi:hypothetical protein